MLSSKAPLLFCRKKGFIGKPKEIAYLIKNKFGSADNIKELGEEEKDEERNHHGSATLPPNSGLHPTSSSIALARLEFYLGVMFFIFFKFYFAV